jgi:hypothetical protein
MEFLFCPMANKRRSRDELKEVGALVERLRDFIRLNYTTAAEVGVGDSTVYSWLRVKPDRRNPSASLPFSILYR